MCGEADDENSDEKQPDDSLNFEDSFISDSNPPGGLPSFDTADSVPGSGADPAPNFKKEEQVPSELDRASIRFQIGSFLAEGGLGEVYNARDLELDRHVVVKKIKERYRDRPLAQRGFLREARITGILEHPGIVPVHGLCRGPSGYQFYVMRKVLGMRMEAAIRHFHSSNPSFFRHSRGLRDLLQRFIHVCNTVEYAHSKGVIHRDIKPENIMLRKYGETLLLDWGLAKFYGKDNTDAADAGSSFESMSLGHLMLDQGEQASHTSGTIPYMSPEQLLGAGEKVGPRSDIFSLGATLYHVLTGVPPKRLSHEEEGLFLLADDAMPQVREINSEVPRALEAICRKAMRHVPQDRYASAAEIARDIEQWLADEAVSSYDERSHEILARLARHHQTRLAAVFAVLVTALITLGIAAMLINQARKAARSAERIAGNALNDMTKAKLETTQILLAAIQGMPELQDLSTTPESIGKRRRITRANLDTLKSLQSISPEDVFIKEVAANHLSELGFLSELEGDLKGAEEFYRKSAGELETLIPLRPKAFGNRQNVVNYLGSIKFLTGRPKEAIPLYEGVIQRIESVTKGDARISARNPLFEAIAYRGLSAALVLTGKLEQGLEVDGKADTLWKTMTADDSTAGPIQNLIRIGFVSDHARRLLLAGKPEEALAVAEPNVARARLALSASSTRLNEAAVFCEAQIVRCRILRTLKRNLPEVRKDLDEVIALEESFSIDLRSDHQSKARLSEACLGRALVEADLGLRAEAIADAEAARRAVEDLTKTLPQLKIYQESLADTLGELAKLKLQAGETAGVESILEQAIALENQVLELNPDNPYAETRLKEHRDALLLLKREPARGGN